jgi:hypothetical protein
MSNAVQVTRYPSGGGGGAATVSSAGSPRRASAGRYEFLSPQQRAQAEYAAEVAASASQDTYSPGVGQALGAGAALCLLTRGARRLPAAVGGVGIHRASIAELGGAGAGAAAAAAGGALAAAPARRSGGGRQQSILPAGRAGGNGSADARAGLSHWPTQQYTARSRADCRCGA